jgi:hypothetical protein
MAKHKYILTASSHHGKCFVCKKKNKNAFLKEVKLQSIIYAFVFFKIYIKQHARCCKNHLDEKGEIREEEFYKIKTTYSCQNHLL